MSASEYPIEENIRDGICKLNAHLLSITEPSLSTATAEHGASGAGGEGRGAVGDRDHSDLDPAFRKLTTSQGHSERFTSRGQGR